LGILTIPPTIRNLKNDKKERGSKMWKYIIIGLAFLGVFAAIIAGIVYAVVAIIESEGISEEEEKLGDPTTENV
jgi:hypothetical protein